MINAAEYLNRAVLSLEDSERFTKTMKEIEAAAEKHVNMAGFYIDVHPERLNMEVGRALQIALQKDGWTIEMTLMPSKLNERLPGHWRIVLAPNETSMNAATVHLTTNQMKFC